MKCGTHARRQTIEADQKDSVTTVNSGYSTMYYNIMKALQSVDHGIWECISMENIISRIHELAKA
jgi:hypothetical protein